MKTLDELKALGGWLFVWSGTEKHPMVWRRIPADDSEPWEFWRRVGVVDGKGDVYEPWMLPEGARNGEAQGVDGADRGSDSKGR